MIGNYTVISDKHAAAAIEAIIAIDPHAEILATLISL